MSFHSGFVCILGRPNAGKSTLLNALVGEKLAIISPKPQTTRNRIQGVVHMPKRNGKGGGQVVLIDTPGVHKPDSSLGRKMMVEVREAMEGCDLVLVIMDVTRKFDPRDQFALDLLKKSGTKAFLVLNKVDLIREKSKLLPLIEDYRNLYNFAEVIPISALKRKGLDVLLEDILAVLPAGPAYFPEDEITDQPARFMAAEIIREQVLLNTSEEIPYSTTVIVDNFEEGARLARIAATIYCEREGQKGILVGKGGQMLKKIGTAARLQIEEMVGTKVYLELFVKVKSDWRESHEFVEGLDWRRQLERLAGPARKMTGDAAAFAPTFDFDADKLVLKLNVKLAADKNAVDPVVQQVMKVVGQMKSVAGKEDAIELALTEALANAVVHGAKADPSKVIECDVACDENRGMLIVVRDPGEGFNPETIPSPVQGSNLYSNGGRGIYLINQLMDEVKFFKNGAEIHMLKR